MQDVLLSSTYSIMKRLTAAGAIFFSGKHVQVATEAFSVSNQTVQMSSEGIFATDQPDPAGDR